MEVLASNSPAHIVRPAPFFPAPPYLNPESSTLLENNRRMVLLVLITFAATANPLTVSVADETSIEANATQAEIATFLSKLPVASVAAAKPSADWLIDPSPYRAGLFRSGDGKQIELNNGLLRRAFRLSPGLGCIALDDLTRGASLLRSVRPEALLEVDGQAVIVGGLQGQPVQNYLDARWITSLKAVPGSLILAKLAVGKTEPRLPWKKHPEWMPADRPWPPPGVSLTFTFKPVASAKAALPIGVEIHYELFDGLPLVSKWLTVHNLGKKPIRLGKFTCEILAATEAESIVDPTNRWELPNLFVETDYTFGGMSPSNHSAGVHWGPDPLYGTQVNYELQTPCLLECRPPRGPDVDIAAAASFDTFRVFELALDSSEHERRGLAVRQMYRTLAPWVTENPVLMHVRSADAKAIHKAVDQCADVGFEMMIMTFGSGFNFESRDPAYQQHFKELADYAKSKHVALGGYSLLASRGAATKAENTQGSPPRFGVMPCLGAKWGVDYLAQLEHFISRAGLGVLEHDGSYPGDLCAAATHPFHHGIDDSQWVNWKAITGFYGWCRSEGVYLNIPDWYFLNGGSKTAMGYRETNWSLPREYQEIIERQNIYDGTWEKTPSMGWMFVPLTQYHGGGAAATIEPLREHLPHYGQRLANLFGAGVQACYRGPELYDGPETRAVVKKWVDFYKRHRAILDSDIIHLRRADGQDIDYILHVNPAIDEKGLLMVYNPLDRAVEKTLTVPLYYTGLVGRTSVSEQDGPAREKHLDERSQLMLPVHVPARGVTWFVFKK